MELLIAILFKLGLFYTPDEVEFLRQNGDPEVTYAQQIIDDGRYYYDAEGGVVIEDDVDPAQ